jgi:hypothetical protein
MAARNIFKVVAKGKKWLVTKDGILLGNFTSQEKAQAKAIEGANKSISSLVIVYRPHGSVIHTFFNSDFYGFEKA